MATTPFAEAFNAAFAPAAEALGDEVVWLAANGIDRIETHGKLEPGYQYADVGNTRADLDAPDLRLPADVLPLATPGDTIIDTARNRVYEIIDLESAPGTGEAVFNLRFIGAQ